MVRRQPAGRWLVAAAAVAGGAVVVSTLKFGRPFLVQFFVNPFQVIVLVLWGLCAFSVANGYMPMRGGGRLTRAANPAQFWASVGFYAAAGTLLFIVNLVLSWMVLSHPR